MCGIVGIYHLSSNSRIDKKEDFTVIKNMSETIKHRGPDDFGFFLLNENTGKFQFGHLDQQDIAVNLKPNILLGHRRLSIIDLSSRGRQPLKNESKSIWLIFNGEIFNYIELRRKLKNNGHVFESDSDSEVVVHAYEEWGKDCVKKFNGMWSFALWDNNKRILFCSRDRFGIKPFYYFFDNKVFIFASEIKAILEGLSEKAEPNWPVIYNYLMHSLLCYNQETFFKKIKRLEPSHSLIVSKNNFKKYQYWDFKNDNVKNYDFSHPEKTFYELFYDSVRIRSRSDVPVALTLSGGLDSSSIAAVFRENMGNCQLKSFSAVFSGFKNDESHYAKLVSDRYKTQAYYIQPESQDLIEDLKKIIWHLDYPSVSTAVFPVWKIMKKIHQENIKVVLEGQGGDELLAGYGDYLLAAYMMERFTDSFRSPSKFINFIQEILKINQLYGHLPFLWLIRRFFPKSQEIYQKTAGITDVLSRDFRAEYRQTYVPKIQKKFPDRLNNELYYAYQHSPLPHLLKYGDALSMAFSIESRLPFLDYRLVEFTFSLPYDCKIHKGITKYILRNSLKDLLPKEILNRNKVGFANPVAGWLRNIMNTEIRPILLSDQSRNRGIYNFKGLIKILDRHQEKKVDLNHYIFRWISLELWFRKFID